MLNTLNKYVTNTFTEKVNNATGAIARFSGPLALLLLLAGDGHALSSRLARGPEKRTLAPVQPPFLG